jgi:outer membrane receptor protein involved in Fe transport
MALSFASNVVAQDADEAAETIEEVVVTGSRIARADIDSASPVTILSREEIEATGLTDVGNLLQRMPSMSGSPIGTTTNNGGNGSVQIDLRGMGVNRTVTLINGMRTVDGGDYQTIPSTMIERIEILKDGASAIYGADAVAGVVNIITRRDFEGIEVSAQYADWFDSEGSQYSVGLISGTEWDSGNFVFGAEYVDQQEAFQADTPWDYFLDSFYIYPEGCENNLTAPYPEGCYRIGSSRIPESRLSFMNQGLFLIGTPASNPYESGLMIPHDGRNYNYAPVNYMQTPFKRTNLFAEAHFDLTDNIRFNAEVRGNFRSSSQELAPLPYTGGDPFHNGTFEGVSYQGVSEENYYLRQAVDRYNAANPDATQLVYEPLVTPRRRMIETNRRFEQDITQYQFVFGLEGTFSDYDWDVFVNQGYRSRQDLDLGQFSGARLHNALGPSADLDEDGQPECYTDVSNPASIIAGCVPLNMFGGGEVVRDTGEVITATLTPDMIDYVSADLVDNFQWKSTQAGASIAGSAWELPGGPMGWAVGYNYWRQTYTYNPDSGKQTGAVTGNVGAGTDGKLTNNGVFGEVLLPVYDNGTQNIYLKGGVRYDDYDAFDGDWTWQVGVEFQALDQLKLRGTAGSVFRAPTISELFGGVVDSFPTYSDPCVTTGGESLPPGCAQEGVQTDNQVRAAIGGNPNLIPETGNTYTAGLVWTPQWGDHGLTATVDWWKIDLEDAISSLGVQYTLDACYRDLNDAACQLVTRDANYQVVLVQDTQLNVADQGGTGVDTEIRWDYSSNVGQWQAALLWSHLIERTKTAFPGADEEDLSGRYTDPTAQDGGAYANDKLNFSVQWFYNDFSLGVLMEYIGGLDADTFCNCDSDGDPSNNEPDGTYIQDVSSQTYFDLVGSYTFSQAGFTLSGGITNLGDKKPPFIEVGFNASTDPATYRIFGRGYYLRAAWKF